MTEPENSCPPGAEPSPGQWLAKEEFAAVVRLTPLVAIDLIARTRDGRVLVGRRIHQPAKGVLFVPGGRITKNETRAAAFKRLTREELGLELDLADARFVGVFEHFYPHNRFEKGGFGTHYIVLAYELALDLELTSLPTDQHGEYLWLTPEELLAQPDVHENTKCYFAK
jgi:colanic acid biosynthesis protein WcaH